MKITFDDLPQETKDYITEICGEDGFEVLECKRNHCFIKSGGVVGIVHYFTSGERNNCVWFTNSEIELMYKAVFGSPAEAMARKGGSAKSEAKTKSSRENGKLGGRPKKNKE